MGDRNVSSVGIRLLKSLFPCLLALASLLFLVSWFFVFRSAGRPRFVDRSPLPPYKLFAFPDAGDPESQFHHRGEPGDDNRSTAAAATGETAPLKCRPDQLLLKVFMYDLPPEFHFELLDWSPGGGSGVWPDIRGKVPSYPGGLNLQHSIEYWLTLDLLVSAVSKSSGSGIVVRVQNSSEADLIFVPFFSSLSYNRCSKVHGKKNRDRLLQEKLVRFLTAQEEWKRSGGCDHVILAHHPNSMLDARMKLWPAMFILSDFGRYPPNIANVRKDVIAPYHHVIRSFVNDSSTFDSRPTLLYFQGAIYRKDGGFVRQELFYLLKDERDVHFQFGSVKGNGINRATQGMHASKFCLNIAGDTPSSNRLFDAISSHCVPVVISDEIELPYEDVLDYSAFCVFVRTSDALKPNFLIDLVRGIGRVDWTRMWRRLQEVEPFFEFRYPSKPGDAVQMIWQAVARKLPAVRLKLHKSRRFSGYRFPEERRMKSLPMPRNFRH